MRSEPVGSAALELAVSHALLTRVAAGELPSTLRVYRPAPAVAFGKLDTLRPGYRAAVAAARAHGYEPVLRLPGGHAAAYHRAVARARRRLRAGRPGPRHPRPLPRRGRAARRRAVDARRRRPRRRGPGRVLPGRLQRQRPRPGQADRHRPAPRPRRRRCSAPRSSSATAPGIRAVLTDVYAALEFDWTATTAGAVDEEVPGTTVDDVERAVIASFGELEPAALDVETLALAHRLEPLRRT